VGYTHSSTRRNVSVIFPLVKPLDGVFLFLLERKIIKVTTDRKLAVDTLPGDVEVLDVEEALLANGGD